jgi:hypothetical protein
MTRYYRATMNPLSHCFSIFIIGDTLKCSYVEYEQELEAEVHKHISVLENKFIQKEVCDEPT